MAEKSTIKVNKNKPTTVDFDLNIEGVDNQKKTTVRLIIEGVVGGCDIAIAATKGKDGQWSVKIPNLKNFEDKKYNVSLEVVVDGYHFVPASGELMLVDEPTVKIVSETIAEGDLIEEGAVDAPGPDAQVTNNLTGKPEFPIEAKTTFNQGHNEDEGIDMDKLLKQAGIEKKKTKISDIAAKVDSHESTQLAKEMEETVDAPTDGFDPAAEAAKIIEGIIPVIRTKPTVKGSIMSRVTKAERLADPAYVAEAEKNSIRVHQILGIK